MHPSSAGTIAGRSFGMMLVWKRLLVIRRMIFRAAPYESSTSPVPEWPWS
jgi:hypothetical protein